MKKTIKYLHYLKVQVLNCILKNKRNQNKDKFYLKANQILLEKIKDLLISKKYIRVMLFRVKYRYI